MSHACTMIGWMRYLMTSRWITTENRCKVAQEWREVREETHVCLYRLLLKSAARCFSICRFSLIFRRNGSNFTLALRIICTTNELDKDRVYFSFAADRDWEKLSTQCAVSGRLAIKVVCLWSDMQESLQITDTTSCMPQRNKRKVLEPLTVWTKWGGMKGRD